MKSKWIAVLLAAFMLLTACSGKEGSEVATTGETEAEVSGKNVLVMATNAQFPPYEFYEGGEIVGIDAEVAAAIAEKLGMELQIDDMEFGAIIGAVTTGKADIGMAGMTITPDRQESVNFSVSYAKGIQAVVVKEGSAIKDVADLDGTKIGVQLATTGDIYASDDFGDENVSKFNKGADAILALTQDKVDAVIIDIEPAKAFIEMNEGLQLLETTYADEDYAIAISKENTELLDKINGALQELIDDGTVKSIIDKYIK